ncbi:transposase [Gemmatimonas sp.]|uniref:transposase n=1 Tax=Gemmatimonas sp. TaxID=1962908 RepID=UPI003983CEC6
MSRPVTFFRGRADAAEEAQSARMKARIDTPTGRAPYAQRFGAVEPVFGNVRYNKGLDRFMLRGRTKVDAQWKLFCLAHTIGTLANTGYAAEENTKRSHVPTHEKQVSSQQWANARVQ